MFRANKLVMFRRVTGWQAVIIACAIAALSVSLATRLCKVSGPQGVSVSAAASQGMRQHMDRDGAQWVAPVPRLIFLQPVTYYPRFAPAGPPLPSVLFDESLYNRPPPSSLNLA